ncbi:MAG: hypothetical protein V1777_03505 [Candidatus Micrarchaeota archaeon]
MSSETLKQLRKEKYTIHTKIRLIRERFSIKTDYFVPAKIQFKENIWTNEKSTPGEMLYDGIIFDPDFATF